MIQHESRGSQPKFDLKRASRELCHAGAQPSLQVEGKQINNSTLVQQSGMDLDQSDVLK
jgi:hypothetical protein